MTWDFFISHASEDKEEVARPLAKLIEEQGLSVWLDQDHLVAAIVFEGIWTKRCLSRDGPS